MVCLYGTLPPVARGKAFTLMVLQTAPIKRRPHTAGGLPSALAVQHGSLWSRFVCRLYLIGFKRRNAMAALAPKSAVRYRPVDPDVASEEPPRITRASRTQPTSKLPGLRRRTSSRLPRFLLPVGLGMILMRFVEGVHPHHPDMLILFQNTQVVFRNAGGTFAPAPHT